jgi:hypothetical protein
VDVIGFVMEAMRNNVSLSMGSLSSIFRQPTSAAWIVLPSCQTSVAAPARLPASTILRMVSVIISSFINSLFTFVMHILPLNALVGSFDGKKHRDNLSTGT